MHENSAVSRVTPSPCTRHYDCRQLTTRRSAMLVRRTRKASPRAHAALFSLLSSLLAHGAFAASPSGHNESTDVVVTAMSGDVSATIAGAPAELRIDSKVALPARIVTGSDGTLGLAQAQTAITVAADTDIEIPAEAAEGQLI